MVAAAVPAAVVATAASAGRLLISKAPRSGTSAGSGQPHNFYQTSPAPVPVVHGSRSATSHSPLRDRIMLRPVRYDHKLAAQLQQLWPLACQLLDTMRKPKLPKKDQQHLPRKLKKQLKKERAAS